MAGREGRLEDTAWAIPQGRCQHLSRRRKWASFWDLCAWTPGGMAEKPWQGKQVVQGLRTGRRQGPHKALGREAARGPTLPVQGSKTMKVDKAAVMWIKPHQAPDRGLCFKD